MLVALEQMLLVFFILHDEEKKAFKSYQWIQDFLSKH